MPSLRQAVPILTYRGGAVVARTLPGPLAALAARGAATAMAAGMRDRRHMIERHLRRATDGRLSGIALQREVQRAFASYARYWLEAFRLPSMSPEQVTAGLTHEGIEHLDAAIAAGNGVILVTPHLGGWDFGGAWLGLNGYPITVVVEPIDPPELFDWFSAWRTSIGLTVVPLGPQVGTTVLRVLKAGGTVALLSDRDIGGTGVEVEFFGERTTLPSGPATLALRTGAAVIPVGVYFQPGGGHHAVVHPPLPVARTGGFRDDVGRVTQDMAHMLEAMIRKDPSQWHLFQPNWPSDRA
jgi:KDO2-lipid IV(A) lauroyltransferase